MANFIVDLQSLVVKGYTEVLFLVFFTIFLESKGRGGLAATESRFTWLIWLNMWCFLPPLIPLESGNVCSIPPLEEIPSNT